MTPTEQKQAEQIKDLEIKISVLIAKNDRLHGEIDEKFSDIDREILIIKEPTS